MSVLTTPEAIDTYRLCTLRTGLRLEIKSMRMSKGKTCYTILKTMGFTGTKASVLEQVSDEIEYRKSVMGI